MSWSRSSHPQSEAVPLEAAVEWVLRRVQPLPAEEIVLEHAAGRRLAEPVVAQSALWPFPRSAMDGFAVRTADVARASPTCAVTLPVQGVLYAGDGGGRVRPGECIRIMTGAPVPEGADAVIPLEQVTVLADGRFVQITGTVRRGQHIFPAGEDAQAGETVLAPGALLAPSTIGLLAAIGIQAVKVYRRPRVAVLAVGNELTDVASAAPGVDDGQSRGHVRDANSPALAAALRGLGADVVNRRIVADDEAELSQALEDVSDCDLVVLTGGGSVGDRDVTVHTVRQMGAEVLFDRLWVKPGKATAFACRGRQLIFALPGSPSAAMTVFWLLVAPAIQALTGAPAEEWCHPVVWARLMQTVATHGGRPHYLWARLAFCGGVPAVWPLGPLSTAVLRWPALANALIELPAECRELQRGAMVKAIWYGRWAPQYSTLPFPVLGVCGPHDSGKTMLLEQLIPVLRRQGVHVGVVKHTHAGFELDRPGKDSWRLAQAGADAVALAGAGRSALQWHQAERPLWQLAALVSEGADLVLVEGFRGAAIPRIEVVPAGAEPTSDPSLLLATVSPRRPSADSAAWYTPEEIADLAQTVQRWLSDWELQATAGMGPLSPAPTPLVLTGPRACSS